MRVRKWVGGGEEKWFQTGESAGGAESWLLVPECFTTSKLLSPSHQTYIWPLVRLANMITSHHQWNLIRSYLSIIYTQLIRLECADSKVWSSITSPLASHCLQHICQEDIRYTWRPVISILIWIIISFEAKYDVFFQVRTILPRARGSCWRGPPVRFFVLKSYFWQQELGLWLSDTRIWYV